MQIWEAVETLARPARKHGRVAALLRVGEETSMCVNFSGPRKGLPCKKTGVLPEPRHCEEPEVPEVEDKVMT